MFQTLKSKIVSAFMIPGTILIIIVYISLYIINIERSKEFNEKKLDAFLEVIVSEKDKVEPLLYSLSKKDPFIKEVIINKNNQTIRYKGLDYNDDTLFVHRKGLGSGEEIRIIYGKSATNEYVNNLKFRMGVVAIAFYILIFLLSRYIEKLHKPFYELVNYFESFKETNSSLLQYKDQNIAKEFIYVKDALNKVVSSLNSYKKKIEKLAYYDKLTNLKNRASYQEKIESLKGKNFTILFLDLDGFKLINDTLGHESGDFVLKEVGRRLIKLEDHNAEVFRIGGDEFIIILTTNNSEKIDKFCNTIHDSLAEDFCIKDQVLNISTSIGISIIDKSHKDPLQEADIAMYEAKASGKNQHKLFKPEMANKIKNKLKLIREIRQATINKEFLFYVQPQYDSNGNIFCAEALIRWNKNGEILSPYFFIDSLESSKYIIPVSNQIMKSVFEYTKEIDIPISINLSKKQLEDKDFLRNLVRLIKETNVKTTQIEFEITERWNSIDTKIVISNIYGLQKLGFKLSIDDFGEDYSSFKRTDTLPISKLKLDKSFIDRLFEKPSSVSSIMAINKYCEYSNIEMLVEGVETQEQKEKLEELGIHKFQGYFFSKPIKKEELIKLLKEK